MGSTATVAVALVVSVLWLMLPTGRSAAQQPQPPGFPALFYGSIAVDGTPPSPGARVTAFIDGVDCTQPNSGRTVIENGVGGYSVTVVHENQVAGCGSPGKPVTFRVDGRPAVQTGTWEPGTRELNLSVGSATPPPPLPTATPVTPVTPGPTAVAATQTHVAQFTPAPAPSALPTDDPNVLGGSTVATTTATRTPTVIASGEEPVVPVFPDDGNGNGGGGLAGWTYGLLALVGLGGITGGVLLSRRKRRVSAA